MLVTPLVTEPSQADYVRSAAALGIRSALLVASWDNLTNKGLLRDVPDRVYVWNEDQRSEAVQLHGVADARVVTTGAHSFDDWFVWQPKTSESQFRAQLGLSADGPLLLYLCSSAFVAKHESPFVERWIAALRSHGDERLRQAAILIRPHPKTGHHWHASSLSKLPGVAIWPPTGALTTTDAAKSDFFDSMSHCTAAVGLNTSAMIENAIVGQPGFTVHAPEFQGGQSGTLHFRYLLRENGGPLTVARSLDEHLSQLSQTLDGEGDDEHRERFLTRFVRPRGLDAPAAAVLAGELEMQAASPAPAPARRRAHHRLTARAVLAAASIPRRDNRRRAHARPVDKRARVGTQATSRQRVRRRA